MTPPPTRRASDLLPRRFAGTFLVAVLAFAGRSAAQTSYPMITSTYPVAVARGTTTEVTTGGREDFAGAYQVFFSGEGVSAEVVRDDKVDENGKPTRSSTTNVKLRVVVADDAAPGVRDFRVATRHGVSSIGQLVIVEGPTALEADKNDSPETAQAITLPVHVNGRIEKGEDVDYYRFHAEAGDAVTFHVLCGRLEDRIHDLQNHADPLLVLSDTSGRELASANNYYGADPLLHHRFEHAGEYLLALRDVRYAGNASWCYVLSATTSPFVLNLFPPAAVPGETVELVPVGFHFPESATASLTIPADWPPGLRFASIDTPEGPSNPAPLVISSLPQQQALGTNTSVESAQPIGLPVGISGRLARENDVHVYRFDAKKSDRLTIELTAQQLLAPLDGFLELFGSEGKAIANNDDAEGKDPRLDWTAPADGTYFLSVRDLQWRGGETYVYYLSARAAQPDFSLECDSDKAMLGPGTSTTWYVKVDRKNGFTGPVAIHVEGLPAGVAAAAVTIPESMSQAAVVLSAAWDAPVGAANVRVVGSGVVTEADGSERTLVRVAEPLEEIYIPGGGRGNLPVLLHTVAVTERSDLVILEPSRRTVSLKPGERARIEVNVKRHPRYTKPITLDVQLRHLGRVYGNPMPPGVSVDESASKTLLGEGETRGHIVLMAADDAAPIRDVPISILGNVSVNFVVKISYSTPPILVTVEQE